MSFVDEYSMSSPSRKKAVRCEMRLACCIERVTNSKVYWSLRLYRVSSILPADIGSRAEVGSSRRITFGDVARTRAIQTRCCCPPESPSAESWRRSLTSSQIEAPFSDSSTALSRTALSLIPLIRRYLFEDCRRYDHCRKQHQ